MDMDWKGLRVGNMTLVKVQEDGNLDWVIDSGHRLKRMDSKTIQ